MDKFLKYISRIAVSVIIASGVFLTVLVWIKGDDAVMTEPLRSQTLDPFFIIAYVALAFCILLALIFPAVQLIQNPKKAIKIVIGIIAIALLWIIAYSVSAGDTVDADILIKTKTSESVARYVGAGLICTYIIFGIAILTTLYTEISKAFK